MAIITKEVTDILSTKATSGGIIYNIGGDFVPLVDRLLKNKFQLYHRSRQKITSTIFCTTKLKPFQLFQDSKQANKPFVVGGFKYSPLTNQYDIDLYEYDNTTDVTLNG